MTALGGDQRIIGVGLHVKYNPALFCDFERQESRSGSVLVFRLVRPRFGRPRFVPSCLNSSNYCTHMAARNGHCCHKDGGRVKNKKVMALT